MFCNFGRYAVRQTNGGKLKRRVTTSGENGHDSIFLVRNWSGASDSSGITLIDGAQRLSFGKREGGQKA